MKYEIIFTYSFKRQLKNLKKKYSHIKDDLNPLLISIEEGELPGDAIPGLLNKVYKERCASSDMKRGKSGGYITFFKEFALERSGFVLSGIIILPIKNNGDLKWQSVKT